MKQTIRYLALLLLYVLTACTMLSQKIEAQMDTQVEVVRRTPNNTQTSVPIRAVFTDEAGDHLYEIRDDGGWESGLRFYEVADFRPTWAFDAVELVGTRPYTFVLSASKTPVVGKRVTVVQNFETGPDTYLLVYGRLFPQKLEFAQGLHLVGKTRNSVLLETQSGTFPFFPHSLKTTTNAADLAVQLFSLTEANALLRELPKAALAGAVVLAGFVLLAVSWPLFSRDHRGVLAVNLLLAALCLGALAWLLGGISLPSSMLPPESIFDGAYYQREYALLLEQLTAFPEYRADLAQTMHQVRSSLPGAFWTAPGAAVGLLAAEWLAGMLAGRRERKRPKRLK